MSGNGGLRFSGYQASRDVANVVVDGAPNESTVLAITHWPGQAQPDGLAADTSAEMAFQYLERPVAHDHAEVATNNHFDQDGAVGLLALTEPDLAQAHRDVLIDIAHAGDFGTYRLRSAARASMALHAFADPERSPIAERFSGDHEADTAVLYEVVLPILVELAVDPQPAHRSLWVDEDEVLSASEEPWPRVAS